MHTEKHIAMDQWDEPRPSSGRSQVKGVAFLWSSLRRTDAHKLTQTIVVPSQHCTNFRMSLHCDKHYSWQHRQMILMQDLWIKNGSPRESHQKASNNHRWKSFGKPRWGKRKSSTPLEMSEGSQPTRRVTPWHIVFCWSCQQMFHMQ